MKRSLILLLLLLVCNPTEARDSEQYRNARYGYEVNVPAGFTAHPEAPNGDGRRFCAADGQVELLVYGSNNIEGKSLKQLLGEAALSLPVKPAYENHGRTWFVLSWLEGSTIHYRKTFVGRGCTQSFWLSYPRELSNRYDRVATELEKSFRPGDLSSGH